MTPIYRSEYGEDAWIHQNLQLPERGIYLDCGANHPTIGNNCDFLRQMGWTGVNVDALDFSAEYNSIGATFVQAVVSCHPVVKFRGDVCSSLARVHDSGKTVAAIALRDILSGLGIGMINFLSLDVEGHEMEALWSLPIERYRPRIIVSEFLTASMDMQHEVPDDRVREFLTNPTNGYEMVHQTKSNQVFYNASLRP
jgi:hypothetical protein